MSARRVCLKEAPGRSMIGAGATVEKIVVVDPDFYMRLRALAQYSGYSIRSLRNKLTDPVRPLPCYRDGKVVTVRRSEYDQWAATHRCIGIPLEDRIADHLATARAAKRTSRRRS